MTDPRQFGGSKPAAGTASGKEPFGPLDCSGFELLLADAAEQTLPASVADQIHVHASGCAACREKLAQALRGREWLLVLKRESLEPPTDLVAKILARTSLAGALGSANPEFPVSRRPIQDVVPETHADPKPASISAKWMPAGKKDRGSKKATHVRDEDSGTPSIPAWQHSSVVVLRRTFIEPRLALVAAMAFFSVALTLNLLGLRLTGLHTADLAPRNMHRAVTRQYAEANARVVRYYENLRIVYEVEARVQQLRRAAQTSTPPQQPAKPRKQSFDSTGDSSNTTDGPHHGRLADNPLAGENKHAIAPALPDPKPIATGPQMEAALGLPLAAPAAAHTRAASFLPRIALRPAPLASSCSLRAICFSVRYFSTRERRLA